MDPSGSGLLLRGTDGPVHLLLSIYRENGRVRFSAYQGSPLVRGDEFRRLDLDDLVPSNALDNTGSWAEIPIPLDGMELVRDLPYLLPQTPAVLSIRGTLSTRPEWIVHADISAWTSRSGPGHSLQELIDAQPRAGHLGLSLMKLKQLISGLLSPIGDVQGTPVGIDCVTGEPVLVGLRHQQESLAIVGHGHTCETTQARLAEGRAARGHHPQVRVGLHAPAGLREGWRRDGALDPLSWAPAMPEDAHFIAGWAADLLTHAFPQTWAAAAIEHGISRGARAILPALRYAQEDGKFPAEWLDEITETVRSTPVLRTWIGSGESFPDWEIPTGVSYFGLEHLLAGSLQYVYGSSDDASLVKPAQRLTEATYLALVLALGRRIDSWCNNPECLLEPGGLHLEDPIGLGAMRGARAGWTDDGRFLTPVTVCTEHPDPWMRLGPRTDRTILIQGAGDEEELMALHGVQEWSGRWAGSDRRILRSFESRQATILGRVGTHTGEETKLVAIPGSRPVLKLSAHLPPPGWRTIRERITIDYPHFSMTGPVEYDATQECLVHTDEESGDQEILTINLRSEGLQPRPGEVFVKDWSEQEGFARAMEKAGLVEVLSEVSAGRFNSRAYLARVLVD